MELNFPYLGDLLMSGECRVFPSRPCGIGIETNSFRYDNVSFACRLLRKGLRKVFEKRIADPGFLIVGKVETIFAERFLNGQFCRRYISHRNDAVEIDEAAGGILLGLKLRPFNPHHTFTSPGGVE